MLARSWALSLQSCEGTFALLETCSLWHVVTATAAIPALPGPRCLNLSNATFGTEHLWSGWSGGPRDGRCTFPTQVYAEVVFLPQLLST